MSCLPGFISGFEVWVVISAGTLPFKASAISIDNSPALLTSVMGFHCLLRKPCFIKLISTWMGMNTAWPFLAAFKNSCFVELI